MAGGFYKTLMLLFIFITNIPIHCSQQPLRILFCMRRFPTNTAWFIVNQMVEFIKQGHEVTIYTQRFDTDSINMNHPDIIKYNLLEKTYTEVPEQKNFDLLLCQSAFLAPHIIELKEQGRLTGKLIMFVREAFKGELLKVRHKIFSNVDLVMPVCEYFKNRLIELGCDENKIVVLYSAINIKKFRFKKRKRKKYEPIKLLSVNRLNEKKGVHYVIRAIKYIIKKHPTLQYTVLGNGSYRPKLESLIRKFRLEKNVHLAGWKTPEEVVKQLANAHIFILASAKSSRGHEEGIPNALMEACATGLPVISTWHAGIPELVEDGVSGFLVPERDVIMLAKMLDYLILHSELWPRMGRAGRLIVEQYFDRNLVNKKLIAICQELVEKSWENLKTMHDKLSSSQ